MPVVATAGHVDHGKSSLVIALTGTDPDRLAEEKRRGMTIELGFASRADDGTVVGFVDVPGHADLVRTMIAGASAVDAALLVVDAREGPMPQTFEHLAVLELLGVRAGIVAITRSDLVDDARIEQVGLECATLLAESNVAWDAPVVTSVVEGRGIDELWTRILATVRDARHDDDDPPRRGQHARDLAQEGAGVVRDLEPVDDEDAVDAGVGQGQLGLVRQGDQARPLGGPVHHPLGRRHDREHPLRLVGELAQEGGGVADAEHPEARQVRPEGAHLPAQDAARHGAERRGVERAEIDDVGAHGAFILARDG